MKVSSFATNLSDPSGQPANVDRCICRPSATSSGRVNSSRQSSRRVACRQSAVPKALQVYQLAYNLIRMLMWRTARACGIDPRRLSFAGTQQRINAVLPRLATCGTTEEYAQITLTLMERIAADILPDRPNRIEPRAVKRRPKNYRRLTKPRAEARQTTYCISA